MTKTLAKLREKYSDFMQGNYKHFIKPPPMSKALQYMLSTDRTKAHRESDERLAYQAVIKRDGN